MRTRVKICCIASIEEAQTAVAHGADAIGLVGKMPSGPGIISDETAREIVNHTPPPVSTFLLTSETEAHHITEHVLFVGADTIQIVNHIDFGEHEKLVQQIPQIRRVQVIHVEDESALNLIDQYQPYVHAFLLDSGKPSAATPELGGTGRTHDWSISKRFVEKSERPVFLAGGLNPYNISDAVNIVQPFGVDLCSGVRRKNKLHAPTLKAFMDNIAVRG